MCICLPRNPMGQIRTHRAASAVRTSSIRLCLPNQLPDAAVVKTGVNDAETRADGVGGLSGYNTEPGSVPSTKDPIGTHLIQYLRNMS